MFPLVEVTQAPGLQHVVEGEVLLVEGRRVVEPEGQPGRQAESVGTVRGRKSADEVLDPAAVRDVEEDQVRIALEVVTVHGRVRVVLVASKDVQHETRPVVAHLHVVRGSMHV